MVRPLISMAAAAALAVAPVAAQAAPERISAPAAETEELGGGLAPGVIAGILVFALIIYLTLKSSDDDGGAISP